MMFGGGCHNLYKILKHIIYLFTTIIRLEDLDLALILRGHHMVKVLKNITSISLVLEKNYPSHVSTQVHSSINVTKE